MVNSKGRIIECTIRIIGERGFTCPISAISAELNCSDTLIYRYFGDRTKLLDVCFHNVCERILSELQEIAIPNKFDKSNFLQYLEDIWIKYVEFMIKNPDLTAYYVQYVWFKGPFPSGYGNSEDLFFRLIGVKGKKDMEISSEIISLLDYILSFANSLTMAVKKGWVRIDSNLSEKSLHLLMDGLNGNLKR